VYSLRRYHAVLVPTAVVILLQPDLLRLAVDAHVQKCHVLRKGEVELKPAAAGPVTRESRRRPGPGTRESRRRPGPGTRQSRRRPRDVADDVPRLSRIDVSFYDAARRCFSVRICSFSDGDFRLVSVSV